jgi:peroxiredoxin
VIDVEGKISHIFRTVKPAEHHAQVLDALAT